MKKSIKIISFILAILLALPALFSCAGKTDSSTDSGSGSSESTLSSEELSSEPELETEELEISDGDVLPGANLSLFPENVFPIYANSEYALRVVIPDYATTAERDVAAKLRSAVKSKTGKNLSVSTDFNKNNEPHNPDVYEILIGDTNYEESMLIYDASSYDSYGIKILGKKMVFYFSSSDQGSKLVDTFKSAITSKDGVYWASNTLSVSEVTTININQVPKYPSTSISTTDCGENTKMVRATKTTLDKFNEYCTTLTSSGYTEYSKRDNIDGNYFRIYTKGEVAVNAYFSSGRSEARVIVGPLKDIPPKDVDPTPETFTPKLLFIAQSERISGALGMLYLLPNGKFIVFDGGGYLSDKIYTKMRELNPTTTVPTIAAWFISHPHCDHQDAIEYFIEQHAHDVKIEGIYFNYATAAYYDLPNPDEFHVKVSDREGDAVTRLRNLLDKKLSRTTKIVKPHTGQVYTFGKSATAEIIWTVEDFLPTALNDINTASMVVRITVAGTSTMILADASENTNTIILKMYNGHLKSDIVTLAHHGVWSTKPELYKRINAKVLLWPNNSAGAKEFYDKSSTSESRKTIQAALDCATDVYLAKGTDNLFTLPYKTVNNKSEFITYIKNWKKT